MLEDTRQHKTDFCSLKSRFTMHTYSQCCIFHQHSFSVDKVSCKLVIVVYFTCQKLCPQCSSYRRQKAEGLICSHISNISYICSHMCSFSTENILSSQALLSHLLSSRNLLPKMQCKPCPEAAHACSVGLGCAQHQLGNSRFNFINVLLRGVENVLNVPTALKAF